MEIGEADPKLRWVAGFSVASCQLGLAGCPCPVDHVGEATRLGEILASSAPSHLDSLAIRAFQGSLMLVKKRFPEAIELFTECVHAARALGSLEHQLISTRQIAYTLIDMTRYDDALEKLDQARHLASQGGDTISEFSIGYERAFALYKIGRLADAREQLLQVVDTLIDLNSSNLVVQTIALLKAIASGLDDEVVADELDGLLAVALLDEGERRAQAAENSSVAERAAALSDLGTHLRAMHAG